MFPLLPVYVGMLTTDMREQVSLGRRIARTLAFVLGISCVFVIFGIGVATLGSLTSSPMVNVVLGLVIFVFGLYLAGLLRVGLLGRERRANMTNMRVRGVAGAFLLGLAFSFGWTPCVGPILGSILALAAEQGGAFVGGALLLTYSLGFCVPFIVITLAADLLLRHLKKLNRYTPIIQRVGGILIAAMGLWMVLSQVSALASSNKAPQQEQQEDDAALVADAQGVTSGETDASGVSSAWKNVVLTDLDGTKHRLSELKGKPVYFEFWGSWCTSCVQDLGQLTEVYEEHRQAGDVQIVSVVVPGFYGERDADDFVRWAREQGVRIPVYMDTKGSLSQYLGVSGFPTSVFVGSDGEIQRIRVGAISRDELEQLLSELQ